MQVKPKTFGILKVIQVTSGKFVWAVYFPDGERLNTYKCFEAALADAKRNNLTIRDINRELL